MRLISFLSFIILFFSCQPSSEISQKTSHINWQQVKGGTCVDYDFINKNNDKVIIIEFWSTSCGPCIEAMHHLKVLKTKFGDELQIICVSSEPINRINTFISDNNFPFDFIYDKDRSLSKVFPHNGIPYSVLIDKNGQIHANTIPGYITNEIITELINGGKPRLPVIECKTKSDEIAESTKINKALVSFELRNSDIADRQMKMEMLDVKVPTQIINGWQGNALVDTFQIINSCTITKATILALYQYAFANLTKARFIFDEELNYINSFSPLNLYNIDFSCSNFAGDYRKILLGQLNAAFNLKISINEKDVVFYKLMKISEKDCVIKEGYEAFDVKGSSSVSFKEFIINKNCTAAELVSLIENQLLYVSQNGEYINEPNRAIRYPVVTDLSGKYTMNISIKSDEANVDDWLKLYAKNGLHLIKTSGKIAFVKIEKDK